MAQAPAQGGAGLGRNAQGLQDDAVALGQLEQRGELLRAGVGVELEGSRIARKPTGASLATPSVPRKSRSPSALTVPLRTSMPERRRDRRQGHAGAGGQRLQQHVARAGLQAGAAAGRMQPGLDQRAAGLDPAGQAVLADLALGAQRDDRRLGLVAIARL